VMTRPDQPNDRCRARGRTAVSRVIAVASTAVVISVAVPSHAQMNPVSGTTVTSPLIDSLLKSAPDGDAERRFWNTLAARGAPIVDRYSHPDSSVVTFVFRGGAAVRAISLASPINVLFVRPPIVPTEELVHAGPQFSRVPSTDVWYLSMVAPNDLRAPYRLRVTTDSTPIGNAGLRAPTSVPPGAGERTDSLNPKTWNGFSVVELPNAPGQPWRSAAAVRGKWIRHALTTRVGGPAKPFWVYVPPDVQSGKARVPLVLGLSSGTFDQLIPAAEIIDAMSDVVRPILAVVDEIAGDDTSRYQRTISFLADELVPWLRAQYPTSTRPRDVIVAGSSRRGVIATLAALARPDVFGNVLSMSGGFSWRPPGERELEWATHTIADRPKANVRFYLSVGTLETGVSTRNQGHYLLATNRHLRDVLRARGYALTYEEVSGVHSELNWQDQFARGISRLLGSRRER
jgi:enterochelin esterase-like enzyme